MRKRLAVIGVAAGLTAGSLAGVAIGVPAISSAQTTSTTAPSGQTQGQAPDPGSHFSDALAPLVANGTITQAQSDAVVQALKDAGPPRGDHGPGDHAADLDAAAKALGMSTSDLQTALQGGQTLAQVATSKGVDVQTVIDALVAQEKSELDQRVAAGSMTQAQADQHLADATTRITDMVDNGRPGGPGGPGRHGPMAGSGANGSSNQGSQGTQG